MQRNPFSKLLEKPPLLLLASGFNVISGLWLFVYFLERSLNEPSLCRKAWRRPWGPTLSWQMWVKSTSVIFNWIYNATSYCFKFWNRPYAHNGLIQAVFYLQYFKHVELKKHSQNGKCQFRHVIRRSFLPPYVYSYKVLFIWVIYVQCTLDDCQSIHDFLKKT